jgi:hypothetical protein
MHRYFIVAYEEDEDIRRDFKDHKSSCQPTSSYQLTQIFMTPEGQELPISSVLKN